MRMHLFARAPDDHIFLLSVHHIVGDFWSLVLVIEEMQALYPAECAGQARGACRRRRRQYRDFVRWQAELLAGPEGERLWAYWERQLAGAPRCSTCRPTGRGRRLLASGRCRPLAARAGPGPPAQGAGGVRGRPRSTRPCWRRSRCCSAGTPARTISSSARPFAGRSRPGFEGVIGYFINMLPLRADLSGDPTFRDAAAPRRRDRARRPRSTRIIRSRCWWSG